MSLIWFEGGDGTGKGTQLELVKGRLEQAGARVRIYREPGGDAVGERIRGLLKDPQYQIEPRTEIMLFCAVRTQNVPMIQAWLDEGDVVLADRSWVSTMAYQVHGRGLTDEADEIRQICRYAIRPLEPDLVMVFDVPDDVARERRTGRGTIDRIELEGDAFMSRVMEGYRKEARICGYTLVDARPSEYEVFGQSVWPLIQQLL